MFLTFELGSASPDPSTYIGLFRIDGWDGHSEARVFLSSEPRKVETGVSCELLVPSPNLERSFDLEKCVWRVALANLAPDHTYESLAEFDRKVNRRYCEFMGQAGWFYTGSYKVVPPSDFMTAEIEVIEASSPEEAEANDGALEAPEDMLDIYSQCRSYYSPPRRKLWLTPIEISEFFRGPRKLLP